MIKIGKWQCLNCNKVNNSHARYCIECGTYPSSPEPTTGKIAWKCPACKTINNDSDKYCKKCGTWLLSTTHEAIKIGGSAKLQKNTNNLRYQQQTKSLKGFYIFEAIIICLILLVTMLGNATTSIIFMTISIIVFLLSLLLIIVLIMKQNLKLQFNNVLKHILVSIIFFILSFFSLEDTKQLAELPPFETYQTGAVNLDYHDLTRNAATSHLGKMVHLKGKVYHLADGKQKYIMVDVTNETQMAYSEVIFVERIDQAGNLIVGDVVDIYGLVIGTQQVKTILGTVSVVPSIESHYIVITNTQ
ncbi:zinc ribbon domain-containing protein [Lysinibacillus sp. FSL H8-0500]|uniref:zinc ribbon domain-containing protein n=1 Tax=Lysinibacillus sp. FSL H8-0500 TaxID=2921393 RepID=UPI003101973B